MNARTALVEACLACSWFAHKNPSSDLHVFATTSLLRMSFSQRIVIVGTAFLMRLGCKDSVMMLVKSCKRRAPNDRSCDSAARLAASGFDSVCVAGEPIK